MERKGKVSAHLSREEVERLIEKVREIRQCLPFLIQLSPEERRAGIRLGDKTIAFVEKALQIAKERKDILPPYIDVEEMERDFELYRNLGLLLREVASLLEAIEDTRMGAGSDAYATALLIYGALKQAAQSGIPGTDTLVEELAQRFPGRGRRRNTEGEGQGA